MAWLLAVLWSSSLGFSQGFLNGSEFRAVQLQADMYLTCNDGQREVTVRKRCDQNQLLPVNEDFFVTAEKVNADRVKFTNLNEKGAVVSQTVHFNKERNRTHRKVVLWPKYFGDRGLLSMGANQLSYELLNSQKELQKSGELTIQVKDDGRRICRDGYDYSYNIYDCYQGDARQFCERHFQWNNYCE